MDDLIGNAFFQGCVGALLATTGERAKFAGPLALTPLGETAGFASAARSE